MAVAVAVVVGVGFVRLIDKIIIQSQVAGLRYKEQFRIDSLTSLMAVWIVVWIVVWNEQLEISILE